MNKINIGQILCIIPARMGSTRLKNKNIREIEKNLSLVDQAIKTAEGFKICVSTDKPEMFDYKDILLIKNIVYK